jgi:hypothetical protein
MKIWHRFNDRKNPTRCITEEACGWGCYEGTNDGMEFKGQHVGALGSIEEAERWLAGDDQSVKPLEIYQTR